MANLEKKIKEASERHGNDEKFLSAVHLHLSVIEDFEARGHKTLQSENSYKLSVFFINNLDIYTTNRFACQIDENFDWGFQIKPSEMVAAKKPVASFRLKLFYQCLKVGDILDCVITSVSSQESQLKVLHKHGSVRMLHDLNISVTLLLPNPETHLNKEDLIRVAVLGIEKEQFSLSVKVTVDDGILRLLGRKVEKIKLGKINPSDLAAYVSSQPTSHPSLTQYLNSSLQFHQLSNHDSFIKGFGLDAKRTYTLFPDLDRIYPEDSSGTKLLLEAKAKDANNFLCLAESELASENFEKALDAASEVLTFDPKCIRACEIRGVAWTKLKNSLCDSEAFKVYVSILHLDPNNEAAKQYFSQLSTKAARKFKKIGKQDKAKQACEAAMELDSSNMKASELLNSLKV